MFLLGHAPAPCNGVTDTKLEKISLSADAFQGPAQNTFISIPLATFIRYSKIISGQYLVYGNVWNIFRQMHIL